MRETHHPTKNSKQQESQAMLPGLYVTAVTTEARQLGHTHACKQRHSKASIQESPLRASSLRKLHTPPCDAAFRIRPLDAHSLSAACQSDRASVLAPQQSYPRSLAS